ncbi:MAG: CRTAC1 family protein [Planctomycetota bacterium JB042]
MPRPTLARTSALAAALLAATGCRDRGPTERPWFRDVTDASGVDFENVCGSPGTEYILDSMGAGVALFDHDGDGDLDLYFVQGSTREAVAAGENPRSNRLYRNDGDLRFTDVTDEAGVGDRGWGHGVAAADVDGDARLDLFVANWGPDVLYRNEGDGRFRDDTAAAGLGDDGWGTSAAFADPDLDGDLDLYVARYVRFDWDHPPPRGEGWKGVPNYAGPQGLTPEADRYYENDGSGRFTDAGAARGFLDVPPAYALAVVWLDADDDGDPDLYVANDTTPNHLFRNDGARFTECATPAGLAYNADGAAQAGMGVACGDADGDGRDDLFVTNFAFDLNTLYRNAGDGVWDAGAARGALKAESYLPMGWGAAFADLDHDADDDLVVVNGHLYPAVDASDSLRDVTPYRQRRQLFRNDGGGAFVEVGEQAGADFREPRCGRGLAVGDLDDDGDVDLVATNLDDRPTILRNDRAPGRWLRVTLRQPTGNRHALGAKVTVTAGGRARRREVRGGGSYLSHSDLRLHFGLGDADRADVSVLWPDGSRSERADVPADTDVVFEKDDA